MTGGAPAAADEAQAALKQARHGAFLSNALKDLAADVNELDSLVADNPPADAPRTRPHFAPFLVTRTSPTWPQVKAALISTFSSVVEPDLHAVEPGSSGMAAVLFVLEGMVDWEADRNSVRQAIYNLSTAVTTATESIRSAKAAALLLVDRPQAERQQEIDHPVDRHLARLAAAPSAREPSVDAPPEQRNAAAGPSGLSAAQVASMQQPAGSTSRPRRSSTRIVPVPPARSPMATPMARAAPTASSSRTRQARRASDVLGGSDSVDGITASSPRKRTRRSEGRSPTPREFKRDRAEEEQVGLVEVGRAGRAAVAQPAAPRQTGSAITLPLVSAFLSLPHLLLIDPVTSTPLIDTDTSALGPPIGLPTGLDDELIFARPHLDNKQIELINKGIRGGEYARSRNTLTLKQEMNLCGLSGSRALAPGQPLVLVTSRSKCLELVEAASRHHGDKDREGINVLLREGACHKWCYKGWYVAVRAASVLLPRGPGARARLELVLRDILEGHCDPTNAKHGRAKDMLADWGFSGGVTGSDGVMEQLEGDCEEDRVMHYVAMRCVEWDDASFDEWSRRRDGRARR